jgi:hypothetical protein
MVARDGYADNAHSLVLPPNVALNLDEIQRLNDAMYYLNIAQLTF